MQITVPSNIENNPLIVTLAGVSYALAPGATITVPDAIANEFYRMVAAKNNPAPAVEVPFEDAGLKAQVAGLATSLASLGSEVGEIRELPAYPETDGTYSLQLVMDDGEATLTWEAVSDGGD